MWVNNSLIIIKFKKKSTKEATIRKTIKSISPHTEKQINHKKKNKEMGTHTPPFKYIKYS